MRLTPALLHALLQKHEREGLIGDLEEDYSANVSKYGERRARWRYRREALVAVLQTRTPELVAVLLGVGGGLLMILGEMTRRGAAIMTILAAVLVMAGVIARLFHVDSFARRFRLAMTTFVIAMMMTYVWIIFAGNIAALTMPLWEHLWRIALVFALGAVFSAPLAGLTGASTFRTFAIALVPVVVFSLLFIRDARPVAWKLRLLVPFWAFAGPHVSRGSAGWFMILDVLLWCAIAGAAARIRRQKPAEL